VTMMRMTRGLEDLKSYATLQERNQQRYELLINALVVSGALKRIRSNA